MLARRYLDGHRLVGDSLPAVGQEGAESDVGVDLLSDHSASGDPATTMSCSTSMMAPPRSPGRNWRREVAVAVASPG